jgi:hypothetical protein
MKKNQKQKLITKEKREESNNMTYKKRVSIIFVIIMVAILVCSTALAVPNSDNKGGSDKGTVKSSKEDKVTQSSEIAEKQNKKEQRRELAKQIITNAGELSNLQVQYDAIEDKESEEALALKAQIETMTTNLNTDKQVAQAIRAELRNEIKNAYTSEELDEINAVAENIRNQYQGIKILPIDSIISNRAQFKFDVPPVIKEGRTLIPVRAITEGLGATVEWNAEEGKVTITKDGTSIELFIDNNVALVNGEEVEMDTQAEIMSSRTVVPLRFIAETFGLDVNWNSDDETIEIDEDTDDDTTDDDTTDDDTE